MAEDHPLHKTTQHVRTCRKIHEFMRTTRYCINVISSWFRLLSRNWTLPMKDMFPKVNICSFNQNSSGDFCFHLFSDGVLREKRLSKFWSKNLDPIIQGKTQAKILLWKQLSSVQFKTGATRYSFGTPHPPTPPHPHKLSKAKEGLY